MIRVFTFLLCIIFAINCSTENNPTSSDDESENTPIYNLSITVSPQEGGSVISDPNQDVAEKGTAFTLTATPNDGYSFAEWAGDIQSTENPIKFNLERDKVIIAEFALVKFYMAENGITVLCPSASNNESGMIEGIEYTKRVELMSISASNAESTCFDPRYEMAKGQSGFWNNIDKSFNSPVNHWDVKGVRLMDYLFKDMVDFDQPLSAWDVSAVENFSGIFMSAESFNQDISMWNLSSATNASNMFNGATNFNQDIGDWDVSAVENFNGIFLSAESFNQDIGDWDVSNVIDMVNMFNGATNFNQDIGDWDVSNVTQMMSTFGVATNFNQDIGDWDVSNVLYMNDMFAGASSFNQDIGDWDVSNVINMVNMFNGATNFNQDLSEWCVSNITTEPSGFATNSGLTEENKPKWGTCPGG